MDTFVMIDYKQFDGTYESAVEINKWSNNRVYIMTDAKKRFIGKLALETIYGFAAITTDEFIIKKDNKFTKSFNKPF